MQLPAVLTMSEAAAVHRQVCAAVAAAPAGQAFELDAAGLTSFDTSLLALLLDAGRTARARGLSIAVTHAPPKLNQLAQMYGVAELLNLPAS